MTSCEASQVYNKVLDRAVASAQNCIMSPWKAPS